MCFTQVFGEKFLSPFRPCLRRDSFPKYFGEKLSAIRLKPPSWNRFRCRQFSARYRRSRSLFRGFFGKNSACLRSCCRTCYFFREISGKIAPFVRLRVTRSTSLFGLTKPFFCACAGNA
nr:MAG TPA: hypothetical protein [Caudoviricetes sp.]